MWKFDIVNHFIGDAFDTQMPNFGIDKNFGNALVMLLQPGKNII